LRLHDGPELTVQFNHHAGTNFISSDFRHPIIPRAAGFEFNEFRGSRLSEW
jgi:hypothetical protein